MNANLMNSAAAMSGVGALFLTCLLASPVQAQNPVVHRTFELAQTVVETPLTGNSITVLAPPRIADYWFSATRQEGGVLVFDGYVPDEATRQLLSETEGADINWLKLGSGEPAAFQSALTFGMAALDHLAQGRLALRSNIIMLTGTAKSAEDYDALMAMLDEEQPQSVVVAQREIAEPERVEQAATEIEAQQLAEEVTPAETPETVEMAPEAPVEAPIAEPTEEVQPKVEEEAPPAPEVDAAYGFSASRTDGAAIVLTGQVPAEPTRRFLGVIADAPVEGMTVTPGAPDDFITSAVAGVRALAAMSEGKLDFSEGRWSLSGEAVDGAARETILSDIAALPAGADWTLDVAMPPAIDLCRTSLAEFTSRNAILFQSGAAIITPDSEPALDELAGDLQACPDAMVYIEGHTDADGDEQLNLALSVARAEAVVNALIVRDIAPARLYAVGYGESEPIADNDTAAGKRLNRRIVVTILDEEL